MAIKKAQTKAVAIKGGEVAYPMWEAKTFLGEDALTPDVAAKLLGWEEIPEGTDAPDPDLKDVRGKLVRFARNAHNRPFDQRYMERYAQDLLNRTWADSRNGEGRTQNGEAISIGRYGNVLSGQKRLAALVFAQQMLEDGVDFQGNKSERWREKWPDGQVSMEALVVVGVDESIETIRTLDNVQPRTHGDVLYAEGGAFKKFPRRVRSDLCKILDFASKVVRDRTGTGADAYAPVRTLAECMEFTSNHKTLEDAVLHVYQNNAEGSISNHFGLGTAAALLYLMGTSSLGKEEAKKYLDADPRKERMLGLNAKSPDGETSYFDKACHFWSAFSAKAVAVKEIFEVRAPIGGSINQLEYAPILSKATRSNLDEKIAVLAPAWNKFLAGEKVTPTSVKMADTCWEIKFDSNGEFVSRKLRDSARVTLGGIDGIGQPVKQDDDGKPNPDEPTEEQKAEIEANKKKIREENAKKVMESRKKKEATPEEVAV